MKARILIIDDDELVRSSLALEAEEEGYRVAVASTGEEALELGGKQSFDLVVCDIRMPGKNGLEVIEELKPLLPNVRFIVITGYASADTPVKALKLRVDDYLLKPFDGEVFLQSVRSVLERPSQSEEFETQVPQQQDDLLRILQRVTERAPLRLAHAERVATEASRRGFSPRKIRQIYLAGLLYETPVSDLDSFPGLHRIRGILRHKESLEALLLKETAHAEVAEESDNFTLPDDSSIPKNNILRLARKHRLLGHFELAQGLYEQILRQAHNDPELEGVVKLEQGETYLSAGRKQKARELGESLRETARESRLPLLSARATLLLARLSDQPEESLLEAFHTFQMWEAQAETACAALLLAAAGNEEGLSWHTLPGAERAKQLFGEKARYLRPAETTKVAEKPELVIRLFGPFRVEHKGVPLPNEAWASRKDRLLLTYLAGHPGRILTEEELLLQFWPKGGDRSRHSLHNSVSQIRRMLSSAIELPGKELVVRQNDGYRLGEELQVDLALFQEDLSQGSRAGLSGDWEKALFHLQRAERLVEGELLEGDYQEWTFPLREEVQRELTECWEMLANYFEKRNKSEVARGYWEKILGLDSCFEPAYESLFNHLRRSGQISELHRLYKRAENAFRTELDLDLPSHLRDFLSEI